MRKIKAYIAGPLFTEGDRWYLDRIDDFCKENEINTYLPHKDAGLCPSDGRGTRHFFDKDYKNVIDSDIMIAVLHGTDVDSGTAWEIGCAYANNKPIFAIADDIRIAKEETNINLMISNSTTIFYDLEEAKKGIMEYIEDVYRK